MITESGVHPSSYLNSHHQIIFAKVNLEILFPTPYFCNVWYYQGENIDLIRQAIDMLACNRAFANTNVNKRSFILNKPVLNIFSNFIPHKTLTVDDKDPWFIQKIKKYHTGEKQCLQMLAK